MYVDEGDFRSLVIDGVNFLHYLNSEAIVGILSGCYTFLRGASYGQTAT